MYDGIHFTDTYIIDFSGDLQYNVDVFYLIAKSYLMLDAESARPMCEVQHEKTCLQDVRQLLHKTTDS